MTQDTTTPPPSELRQALLAYGLLWCLGLYLRLTVLVVPPLIPQLRAVLGFTSSEVAIATSLPLVTLAFGALLAGWLLAAGATGPLAAAWLGAHWQWAFALWVAPLPRLMAGMLFFGYLLVFGITVVGGWLNDLSGTVALAFLPTLLISLVAMAVTPRLLASRQ